MKRERDDIDRLLSFLDAVEDGILRMLEKDIPEEIAAEASRDERIVGEIIHAQLKAFGKRKMEVARRGADQARVAQAAARGRLPDDPALRRKLLESVIANDAGRVPKHFTMAFREMREITDAEVESILTALILIGVVDPGGDRK